MNEMMHLPAKTKEQNPDLVLHLIHPGFADFLDGFLSSLAPLFSVDTALAKAVLQIVLGGVIVFINGILTGGVNQYKLYFQAL
jgi:hypothetical protein